MSIMDHKTKITGAALAVVSALQATSSSLQAVLPPTQFAWVTTGIGVLVTILGFANSNNQKPPSGGPK
jgi:hypothetical protein